MEKQMTAMNHIETFRGVVYPADCDAMGHMNVRQYSATFDQAMWHLVHELGYRTPSQPGIGHGWADVRHTIDYHRELRAGHLYRVLSDVRKIGQSSLVTHHRMFELGTGELSAECEMISVYFDLEARTSCPIPEMLRNEVCSRIKKTS
jgi:acyl-CoA thioester hydrolase